MVSGHGCWTYANEGILLCLGLGLLLLDLLGVAALRVCIRLGFHFVICISKQLIKSIHYFRRNSNHSGEDGIGVT